MQPGVHLAGPGRPGGSWALTCLRKAVGDAGPELQSGRKRAAELLARLTGKSREEAEAALQSEDWLSAEEEAAFGLADRVIETL